MEPVSFQGRRLSPRCVTVSGATILPSRLRDEGSALDGGIYDALGALVPESLRPARLGHWAPSAPVAIGPSMLAGAAEVPEAIFGGHLFLAWGHFLLETLSTAWAIDLPPVPVVLAPFAHRPDSAAVGRSLERVAPLLGAAGWGGRPVSVVTRTLRVGTLHVPERLAVFGAPFDEPAIHPAMAGVYARLRRRWAGEPRGPVLALRPEGHPREHPAERELRRRLDAVGARAVDGALLTPEQQVEAFGGATALIGFSGSNLHNAAFCSTGTPVIEIADARSSARADPRNRTQAALASLLDQPYQVVRGFEVDAEAVLGRPRTAEALMDALQVALATWTGSEAPAHSQKRVPRSGRVSSSADGTTSTPDQ